MSKAPDDAPDDLEAVRKITEALRPFKTDEQDRIIRWAKEKLGLLLPFEAPPQKKPEGTPIPSHTTHPPKHTHDIKTFVNDKNPTSDTQFAVTVAYYYRFEVPEAERKDSITGNDLREACRKVNRLPRLNDPGQTLRNAHMLGYLDKAGGPGIFSINTVGENLVAMTLPGGVAEKFAPRKKTSKKTVKKAAPKKAEMQKSTKRK